MTPEIVKRLAEFEARHKPDSKTYLAAFREEVVYLYFKGYSLKATFVYLQEQGVGCSLRTFERWVKENIDFSQEPMPDQAKRSRPWPAESHEEGQGSRGRIGQVATKPLVSDDAAGFSLAGAAADSPALIPNTTLSGTASVVAAQTNLPKLPVLVDEKGGPDLQSVTSPPAGSEKAVSREQALKEARARREEGFKTPVDRALDPERDK